MLPKKLQRAVTALVTLEFRALFKALPGLLTCRQSGVDQQEFFSSRWVRGKPLMKFTSNHTKFKGTVLSGVCVYSGTCGSDECEKIGAVWLRCKSLSIIDF